MAAEEEEERGKGVEEERTEVDVSKVINGLACKGWNLTLPEIFLPYLSVYLATVDNTIARIQGKIIPPGTLYVLPSPSSFLLSSLPPFLPSFLPSSLPPFLPSSLPPPT
jgi:hypothetical protein